MCNKLLTSVVRVSASEWDVACELYHTQPLSCVTYTIMYTDVFISAYTCNNGTLMKISYLTDAVMTDCIEI